MEKKEIVQIKTCELYDLLSVKCVDIQLAYQLLGQVYNIACIRHQLFDTKTPETESLARWSLSDARNKLDDTLRPMNICSMDKDLIRYIANNYEFEEK